MGVDSKVGVVRGKVETEQVFHALEIARQRRGQLTVIDGEDVIDLRDSIRCRLVG